ncbi:hypothetical protein PPSIR1_09356 [Plesiocystis pacifica SIR-1]|uniref:Lipoprotein n=1 Tax=Plesiocystis pacifica SIR-1 TaxID=391625 RepID=A6GIL8_9BACT|nr:hypothetical protein [Plesiocystis pacifica]EDM74304.1 hypothetical protein PPSIR1_09356 [Plesiocystis pacifica SIR-1]
MRSHVPLLLAASCVLLVGACNKVSDSTHVPLGTESVESEGSRGSGGRKAEARSGWDDWDGAATAGEAAPAPAADASVDRSRSDRKRDRVAMEEADIAENHSPGLGTAYGEHRRSHIESVGFRRSDPSRPDVVFTIRYDDAAGVRSAARARRTRAWSDEARRDEDGLTFALLDAGEEILPAAAVGAELYAVGRPNQRYMLAVANGTSSAFELVASVDGLDVIDGGRASFDKRGYVIDPFSSVVIEGWRTSEEAVAAFRFSSLEDSYAERMGDGRNVGVIGAALFREAPVEEWRSWEDDRPSWDRWRGSEDETWRRESADPFPGN